MTVGMVVVASLAARAAGNEPADHVNEEANEVGCKLGKAVHLATRISALNSDVLTFHVAQLAQAFVERCRGGRRRGSTRRQ